MFISPVPNPRRSRLQRASAFLLVLAVGSACGNEPNPCGSVSPTVTLTGPAPVFDWTSSCPAGSLEIAPSDSLGNSAWLVMGQPGFNTIQPPVTYGEPAQGAAVETLPDTLISGRQYRLILRQSVGPGGFGLALMGQTDFTAP
jgi:hypothetical protein